MYIMEGIDLNIENYDLTDLLSLFKLDLNFSSDELKKAKKSVMQSHPDKSGLDKKYFLFFSSAYKIIYSIHEFRRRGGSNKQSTEYSVDKDEAKEALLKEMQKQPNFNKMFNELFEKYKIKDDENENGYGDWLKSEENIDTRTTTMQQMNSTFEQKKKEIKELIPYQDIVEADVASGFSDLAHDKPAYYSSSLFSTLQYEDLKKAHVESVIPVSQEDYLIRPKFKSVLEMQEHPDYKNVQPLSLSQSNDYLKQQQSLHTKNDVHRAYKLAKQDEVVRKANEGWMSSFKQLTI